MIGLILAVGWGACILLAFIGWGALLNRLLAPEMRFDWAQRAVFGISVNIGFGGLLNLMGLVSRPVLLVLTGLGVAIWGRSLWNRRREVGGAGRRIALLCGGIRCSHWGRAPY